MKRIFVNLILVLLHMSCTAFAKNQTLLATIKNGKIFNTQGQPLSREELAGLGFPLSEQELKKFRVLNIYSLRTKPINKIFKTKNDYGKSIKLTSKCIFDVNGNKRCDFYSSNDIQVASVHQKVVIHYVYQGAKEACWVSGAQKCEFHLNISESHTIYPKASAFYSSVLPIALKSRLQKVKFNIQVDQIIQQRPVECRQYVVALKMNEYSGYYRAHFYEKEGWNGKKFIGVYQIPKMKWKVVVPGHIKAEGWLGC